MAKIAGAAQFTAKLRNNSVQAAQFIDSAVFELANRVQVDAQNSITEGAVSGAGHVASKPGTPPNNDTGVLANNIETIRGSESGTIKYIVSSNAPYAAIHEFGGTINHPGGTPYFVGDSGVAYFVSKDSPGADKLEVTKPHTINMPARPYMAPALEKNRERIAKRLAAAINQANRMK